MKRNGPSIAAAGHSRAPEIVVSSPQRGEAPSGANQPVPTLNIPRGEPMPKGTPSELTFIERTPGASSFPLPQVIAMLDCCTADYLPGNFSN